MNEKEYYEWLHAIDGTANPARLVLHGSLPFLTPRPAIDYARKAFPDMGPDSGLIYPDKGTSTAIAIISQHEVEYLISELSAIGDDLRKMFDIWDKNAKDLEGKHDSIMDAVNLQLAEQRRSETANQMRGVLLAQERLRSRLTELHTLAGRNAETWGTV